MASVDYHDWSSLLPELLEQVAAGIKLYSDYVRFRAVCNPWRSSTRTTPATHPPCQIPWLLFPHGGSILSVNCKKNHYLRLSEALHDNHRRCRASSHGWVFISEPIDVDDRRGSLTGWVFILNPLTGAKLSLPPLLGLLQFSQLVDDDDVGVPESLRRGQIYKEDSFIRKFALSVSPSQDPDFTALAILAQSGKLACCKSGQNHWTLVPGIDSHIWDAVYLNGMVYAVDRSGNITICDVNKDSPEVVEVMLLRGLVGIDFGDTYYLVCACDELLLVARFPCVCDELFPIARSCKFKVYKLNSFEKRWEGVNDVGNLALFVGGNSCSWALTASDFPGCKGNSIYFTDDCFEYILSETPQMGIFSLENESIQPLPCNFREDTDNLDACVLPVHPIWITLYSF